MNIAIIENNIHMAKYVAKNLIYNWYQVNTFNSYNEFKTNYSNDYDLYIIDILLDQWDWFEIIKWLRTTKKINVPIIIMSSYNDIEKKVYGLDIWADDYLVKPFQPDELLARIRTLFRRTNSNYNSSIIKHNDIDFYLKTKELYLLWEKIHFTKKELLLIELFLLKKWKLITKSKLINNIWWNVDSLWISDNNINVVLSKVRKKLWKNFNLKTIINWWYILK